MSCKPVCAMCSKIRISESIAFSDGTLIVNLPAGYYENCGKYCIILAQAIPPETTINAPVVITIGEGTEQYPLTRTDCSQVTACGIRTRTKYSVCVSTNATGGVFKMLGKPHCYPRNNLPSINGTAPAPTPAVPAARVAQAAERGGKA